MIKTITILGSTGSIGTQALEVCKKLGIQVQALTAKSNIALLEKQIREYKPKAAAVYDKEKAKILKENISDLDIPVYSQMEGLCKIAADIESDIVLNSVVGMVGLKPTLEAINNKRHIALANKETLVAGGELVTRAARENGVKIIPVDSEHSAIFQCMQGMNDKKELKKIILTASGGPFFGKKMKDLENITKEQALKHPNWSMGAKITIDSATMMNKGLEIAEAKWLFDIDEKDIDVVIHRESIIHSMIEYKDNSVIAQMGVADMRVPIQYAITYPQRYPSLAAELDLTQISTLTFFKPDYDTFLCLKACKLALQKGGLYMAVANGANEQAVELFLKDEIKFLDIGNIVLKAVNTIDVSDEITLENILKADNDARNFVLCHFNKK
ncbi:MAG: 1-deoxy-D-xylulose-5-phosphate reductoisomerase [Clostridia bacterium]|nr:1-deoxy-D-xylulose-5-phosphate reductoisomerase [Clostridia bacterium]